MSHPTSVDVVTQAHFASSKAKSAVDSPEQQQSLDDAASLSHGQLKIATKGNLTTAAASAGADVGTGVSLSEPRNGRCDDQVRGETDCDRARLRGSAGASRGPFGGAQQFLGSQQERHTGIGELGAPRCAVKGTCPDLMLQALDLAAQRRLREVQHLGRVAEVTVLGHDVR